MSAEFEAGWHRLVSGETRTVWASAARGALWALSGLYAGAVAGYRGLLRTGALRITKLPCVTVSVGNLTVGGTGKTTTVRWLARWLQQQGLSPGILSYGYRAGATKEEKERIVVIADREGVREPVEVSGDEAQLLARSLPGVPLLIGRRRVRSGRQLCDQFAPDICLLDDAFQYWRLAKDLEIVLVNAANPFGHGYLLPRGMLREPVSALRRAHAAIITHADRVSADRLAEIRRELQRVHPQLVVAEAIHAPTCLRDLATGAAVDPATLRHGRWLPLSALGSPESFEQSLTLLGAHLTEPLRFPDHHRYIPSEIDAACRRVREEGLAGIVTTEKDSVKMGRDWGAPTPMRVLEIDLQFTAGQNELEALLQRRIALAREERSRDAGQT